MDVVKEDMKVCNRLKMEAADWPWPPKGSGNSCFFFHGRTSDFFLTRFIVKKIYGFFSPTKQCLTEKKISKSHKRDFQKSGLLPSSPSLPWPGIYPYHSTIAFFPASARSLSRFLRRHVGQGGISEMSLGTDLQPGQGK